MFSKKKELQELVNTYIEKLKLDIKKEEKAYDNEYQLYKNLEESIEQIVYIKDNKIKQIINKFDVDKKEDLYKELITIKNIITMNKDFSSTLRLFKNNKIAYQKFLDGYSNYLLKLKKDNQLINNINEKINTYEELLTDINNKNFNINSKNIKLLEEVFVNTKNYNIELLIELMNYEKSKYEDLLYNSKLKEKIKLTDNDLQQIFNKYGYRYNNLDNKYKNYLKEYGNLSNIEEVFIALGENNYPNINNMYILTSLLLGSSYEVIDKVTKFSIDNHLIPKSLLDISGALLVQKEVESTNNIDDYYCMIAGSSLDFMKNIMTLKDTGLSINYIYQECKSILTMPNTLLRHNLDLFYKYGFSFEYKRRGIIDPSPASLLSTDFANICDTFIEIHPLGLKYLTDNLSNLRTVSNKDALMFYNIYASEEISSNLDDNDPKKGPFRKVLEVDNENYQLKAIITRNRPDYKNSYYLGINEENKREITKTIDVTSKIKKYKKYQKITDKNQEYLLDETIFNNSYIEAINKYIDKTSPLSYNFLGVRISRLKVLRIYNTLLKNNISNSLDSLMYAITYNTIINLKDYDKILNCVKYEVEAR